MDINFPSAIESRDKLSTRNNQVFQDQLDRVQEAIANAISSGCDRTSVTFMSDQTKKFLENKGYIVKEESSQRDSYWQIEW